MCECGCGELRPIAKIRGEGGWHFLEIYPGCTNCRETSWGLGVTWLVDDDDMLDEWLLNDTPTVTFDRFGQWGRRILDTQVLKRLYREEYGEDDDGDALEEFIRRGGLRDVFYETPRVGTGGADTPEEKA